MMKTAFLAFVLALLNQPCLADTDRLEAKDFKTKMMMPLLRDQFMMEGDDHGGMTGGGGKTINPDPVGIFAITPELTFARPQLLAFLFKGCRENNGAWSCEISGDTYLNEILAKMIPFIAKVGITEEIATPCFDSAKEDKDGSIYGKPDKDGIATICISGLNLAHKLTIENVHNQTLALIAHEYSHLAGADEATAVDIQKIIIARFAAYRLNEFTSQLEKTKETAAETVSILHVIQTTPLQLKTSRLIEALGNARTDFNNFADNVYSKTFSLAPSSLHQNDLPVAAARINALLATAREYGLEASELDHHYYQYMFQNGCEVSAERALEGQTPGFFSEESKKIMIPKMTTTESLQPQLLAVIEAIQRVKSNIEALMKTSGMTANTSIQ